MLMCMFNNFLKTLSRLNKRKRQSKLAPLLKKNRRSLPNRINLRNQLKFPDLLLPISGNRENLSRLRKRSRKFELEKVKKYC